MKKYCKDFSNCQENAEAMDNYHIAGLGETLERNYKCKKCGRKWREVFLYSCQIDNQTEKMLAEN